MKPYRHGNGRIQARGGGGRFRQWQLDSDFGVRECPWCHTLSAHRPDLSGVRHIDPAEFNRRVCGRCGWDSAAKHEVDFRDWRAAAGRFAAALGEANEAADQGVDVDVLEILEYQARAAKREFDAIEWLSKDAE